MEKSSTQIQNADQEIHELYIAERLMVRMRWFGALFALLQVETYYLPYPDDAIHMYARMLVLALLVGNFLIWTAHRKCQTVKAVCRLAKIAMCFDFLIIFALISVYTFDVNTAMFILVYLLPLEGAVRFQKKGAFVMMGLAAVAYTLREYIGSQIYNYDFLLPSISFRMGIGVMIAAVAGSMAARYIRERKQVTALYEREHEAAGALRAADEIKNTFLKAVSHELRTPLTAVCGISLTLQRSAPELQEKNEKILSEVVKGAEKLDSLLKDMLDVDRLAAGQIKLNLTEGDIGEFIANEVNEISMSQNKEITCDIQNKVMCFDRAKVERILENLILNAIKYTPEGTQIWVVVKAEEDGITLTVKDNGPGIPNHLKQTIFEPFRRREKTSKHAPGTGIGLSLVANFAKMHHGRAWVEDRADGGASFHVFLGNCPK